MLVLSFDLAGALSIDFTNIGKGGGQPQRLTIQLVRLSRISQIVATHMRAREMPANSRLFLGPEVFDYGGIFHRRERTGLSIEPPPPFTSLRSTCLTIQSTIPTARSYPVASYEG